MAVLHIVLRDRTAVPDFLTDRAFNTQLRQFPGNSGKRETREELSVYDSHSVSLLFVNHQFSVFTPVIAKETPEGDYGLSVGQSLLPAPSDVKRDSLTTVRYLMENGIEVYFEFAAAEDKYNDTP